jgi:hypothetical protein
VDGMVVFVGMVEVCWDLIVIVFIAVDVVRIMVLELGNFRLVLG